MAVLRITNLTASSVLIQDLYASVPANSYIEVDRPLPQVTAMKSLLTAISDGSVSITIQDSAAELQAKASSQPLTVWSAQKIWYIDGVNGSDGNTGASSSSAIRSWAEFRRRIGNSLLQGHYYVFLPYGLPSTDLLDLTALRIGVGFEIHFIGARAQVATGTVSAVTTFDRTTGQHTEVTVAGFDWAPHVGRMIRVTSGARVGVTAWVDADLTGGKARVSPPQQTVYGTSVTTSWSTLTQTNIQVGDPIEVVTLAEIAETPNIDYGQGTTGSGRITFEDFYFSKSALTVGTGIKTGSVRLLRCDVRYQENTGGTAWTIYQNSKVGTLPWGIGRMDIRGGLVTGSVDLAAPGGISLVGFDCLFSAAARLTATAGMGAGMLQIANVGVAGCTGVFCTINIQRSVQLTGILYGTTANQIGFQVRAGGALISSAGTTPTLNTGAAANIDMRNAVTKAWADLATTYTNPATGSQILYDV